MFGIPSKKPNLVLEGGGLRLRPGRKSDYVSWQSIRAKSRQFLAPFEPSWSDLDLTRRAFDERLRCSQREARRGNGFSFLLFDIADANEILIGGLTLSNVRYRAARHANIGYWMGIQYAGKGHMSQGVALSLPFVFEYLNLRPDCKTIELKTSFIRTSGIFVLYFLKSSIKETIKSFVFLKHMLKSDFFK